MRCRQNLGSSATCCQASSLTWSPGSTNAFTVRARGGERSLSYYAPIWTAKADALSSESPAGGRGGLFGWDSQRLWDAEIKPNKAQVEIARNQSASALPTKRAEFLPISPIMELAQRLQLQSIKGGEPTHPIGTFGSGTRCSVGLRASSHGELWPSLFASGDG